MRRVASTDGVELAVHDLGGSGPIVVMAHATGFHAHVFAPLAAALAGEVHSFGPDLRGHGDTVSPADVTYEWSGLGDDVRAAAGALGERPLLGFGHSSGAAALLLAEAAEPGLFRGLYCFEPILWPDPAAAKGRAHALAEGARRRRPSFATREDAYANYESKPPFSWMDTRALAAYVEHGFRDGADGDVVLKCAPQTEALTYLRGAECRGFEQLDSVACPVVIARGTERMAVERETVEAQAAALPAGTVEELDGLSHFGPLERPKLVAASVRQAFLR